MQPPMPHSITLEPMAVYNLRFSIPPQTTKGALLSRKLLEDKYRHGGIEILESLAWSTVKDGRESWYLDLRIRYDPTKRMSQAGIGPIFILAAGAVLVAGLAATFGSVALISSSKEKTAQEVEQTKQAEIISGPGGENVLALAEAEAAGAPTIAGAVKSWAKPAMWIAGVIGLGYVVKLFTRKGSQ